MIYILMSKNTELAKIEIAETGRIVKVDEVYNKSALPVGSLRESVNLRDGLDSWWQGRSIPASREGLNRLLDSYNIASSSILAVKGLGLSLSDQYWIKPESAALSWDEINFFDNDFSQDIGEAFFSHEICNEHIDFRSPDNTSDGWLKKKWIIKNGERCLVKTGSSPFNQEPFNEVIASYIAKQLGIDSVQYDLYDDEQQGMCSICRNFITKDTELVSAYALAQLKHRPAGVSLYKHLLDVTEEQGISNAVESIDNMLILDYIIANKDRHAGSFGFIRDTNTLKYIGAAPIYDSGTSLWHNYSVLSKKIGEAPAAQPFYASQENQMHLVKQWDRFDFSKLKNLASFMMMIFEKNKLSEYERNKAITEAAAERLKSIQIHQHLAMQKYYGFNENIAAVFKTFKSNFQAVYNYYKEKFAAKDKIKYDPKIDKKLLKALLDDGFSIEKCKKIMMYSPNIKSRRMFELLCRSISHDEDYKKYFIDSIDKAENR